MDDHEKVRFLRELLARIDDGTAKDRGIEILTVNMANRSGDRVLPIADLLYELVEETDGTVAATVAYLASVAVSLTESYAEMTGLRPEQFIQAFARAGQR